MIRQLSKQRAVLLLAAGLMAAGSASSATVEECLGDVAITKGTILAATTFVNAVDQTALAGKADSAYQKINRGKFNDAATDLSSMRSKVASLVGAVKPKLGAEDGAAITGDIDISSNCLLQLISQP